MRKILKSAEITYIRIQIGCQGTAKGYRWYQANVLKMYITVLSYLGFLLVRTISYLKPACCVSLLGASVYLEAPTGHVESILMTGNPGWLIGGYRQLSNIRHVSRQLNCWTLRRSWSIACRRCSNYIFILELTPGFNGLGKDNYKTRRETFELEVWWYIQ